jgi:phosphonate transport system permease protein
MTNFAQATPPRFRLLGLPGYVGLLVVLALVVSSLAATAPATDKLARGITRLFSPSGLFTQMFPPDFTPIGPISWKPLETLQMAFAGCFLGLIFAVPFAILATDRLSPHPVVRANAWALIALFRTAPDLVWAIIFIIIVGPGPAAGVMAILVDKIGFAGRFFADAMEETAPGPQDALRAIGACRMGGSVRRPSPPVCPRSPPPHSFHYRNRCRVLPHLDWLAQAVSVSTSRLPSISSTIARHLQSSF